MSRRPVLKAVAGTKPLPCILSPQGLICAKPPNLTTLACTPRKRTLVLRNDLCYTGFPYKENRERNRKTKEEKHGTGNTSRCHQSPVASEQLRLSSANSFCREVWSSSCGHVKGAKTNGISAA